MVTKRGKVGHCAPLLDHRIPFPSILSGSKYRSLVLHRESWIVDLNVHWSLLVILVSSSYACFA